MGRANDQQMFYWLLLKYRESQLENYGTNLTYSPSDIHHLRPKNWKKKVTTRQFPPKLGRTPSRFTVISTVATGSNGEAFETATDTGMTTQSYDPYKSSLNLDVATSPSHAKIIVRRNGSLARLSTHASSRVSSRPNGSIRVPRRTLSSIRSGESLPFLRTASRQKRGVDFTHVRKHPVGPHRDDSNRVPASIAGDDTTVDRDHMSPNDSAREARLSRNSGRGRHGTQTMSNLLEHGDKTPWMDEIRNVSNSIAKDCDDAFNSTLLSVEPGLGEACIEPSTMSFTLSSSMSPLAMSTPAPGAQKPKENQVGLHPWDTRPLPQPPPCTESVMYEIRKAKNEARNGQVDTDKSPGHADRVLTHLNRLVQPDETERRVASAPIYSEYRTNWGKNCMEFSPPCADTDKQRAVSAPTGPTKSSTPGTAALEERKGFELLSQRDSTIRVVTSPSNPPEWATIPAAMPAPLRIRKKVPAPTGDNPGPKERLDLRQQYRRDAMREPIAEEPSIMSQDSPSVSSSVRKKPSWFKRTSKEKDTISKPRGDSVSSTADYITVTDTNSSTGQVSTSLPSLPLPKKKKSFAFWRNSKEPEPQMEVSLAGKQAAPSSIS